MKKLLSIAIMLLAVLTSCSNQKEDGIYKTEYGWDIVHDGKTYEYRCEGDGIYLYIDWDGRKSYTIGVWYNHPIYLRTVGHESNYASTTLNFLTKNKDEKYVYVANYFDFDGCFYDAKNISFDIDGGSVQYQYSELKPYFSLLEKYVP